MNIMNFNSVIIMDIMSFLSVFELNRMKKKLLSETWGQNWLDNLNN